MAKYPDRSCTMCPGSQAPLASRRTDDWRSLLASYPVIALYANSDEVRWMRYGRTCLATHFSEYSGQNRDRPDLSEELRSVGCRFRKIWLGRHFRRCFRRYLDRFLVRPRIGRRWRNAGRLIRWRSLRRSRRSVRPRTRSARPRLWIVRIRRRTVHLVLLDS